MTVPSWMRVLPGGELLSDGFCNKPIAITFDGSRDNYGATASVVLCGLPDEHKGDHQP